MQIKPHSRLHNCLLSCEKGRHHPAWMPQSVGRLETRGFIERYVPPLIWGIGWEAAYRLTETGVEALKTLKNGEIVNG